MTHRSDIESIAPFPHDWFNESMTVSGGSTALDPFADHRRFVAELATTAPIGSVAFRRHLQIKQEGRFRRVRNDLIGMSVVRFQGGRGASRSLVLGEKSFDEVLADGLEVRPGREIGLYPLLMDPIDELITEFHRDCEHKFLVTDESDGVTPYFTYARGVKGEKGSFTRPDITVIADLYVEALGAWADVHAIEVKPYWSLGRDSLFEAAAQASLQRCSFAWLIAYIPGPGASGLSASDGEQRKIAQDLLLGTEPGLLREAKRIGIGIAVAEDLREGSRLVPLAAPRRQAMDPKSAGLLFESLSR